MSCNVAIALCVCILYNLCIMYEIYAIFIVNSYYVLRVVCLSSSTYSSAVYVTTKVTELAINVA